MEISALKSTTSQRMHKKWVQTKYLNYFQPHFFPIKQMNLTYTCKLDKKDIWQTREGEKKWSTSFPLHDNKKLYNQTLTAQTIRLTFVTCWQWFPGGWFFESPRFKPILWNAAIFIYFKLLSPYRNYYLNLSSSLIP